MAHPVNTSRFPIIIFLASVEKLHSKLLVCNRSFMGGINFWGGHKEDHIFLPPSFDDKILEVVAVFGSVQMAASRLINLQHHRIAQCQTIQINILGEEGVPIQVDGEAWIQPPGIIRILHKNRMQMLCRYTYPLYSFLISCLCVYQK